MWTSQRPQVTVMARWTITISLILVNEFYQIFCRIVLFLIINDVILRDLTSTIMEFPVTGRIESYWQCQSRLHATEATHLNFCRILLHTNMKLQVLITNNSAQAFLCEHAVAQTHTWLLFSELIDFQDRQPAMGCQVGKKCLLFR